MGVKNIKEDIIFNIVEEVLKSDSDLSDLNMNKDDIVAYILNRTPPKYTTSERGVLHGKLEARYIIQQKTDILMLLYEAIDTFRNRRDSQAETQLDDVDISNCRFSHIFGEILEESTFTIVPNVDVTLLYKGKPAEMVNPGWKNPYLTNRATMGFYHFWPVYKESMGSRGKIPFQLKFENPNFIDRLVDIEVELLPRGDIGKSHVVPITLLKTKEGVKLDYLEDK